MIELTGTSDADELSARVFIVPMSVFVLRFQDPCQVVVDNIRKTITLYQAGEPYPVPPEFQQALRQTLQKCWCEKFGAAR